MIISEISQIDRLVEEALGSAEHLLTMSMADYAYVKKQSASLKAIKIDVPVLTHDAVQLIEEAINEAGVDNVSNLLYHIRCNSTTDSENAITLGQVNMLIELLNRYFAEVDLICGMGVNDEKSVSILIILGYDK